MVFIVMIVQSAWRERFGRSCALSLSYMFGA